MVSEAVAPDPGCVHRPAGPRAGHRHGERRRDALARLRLRELPAVRDCKIRRHLLVCGHYGGAHAGYEDDPLRRGALCRDPRHHRRAALPRTAHVCDAHHSGTRLYPHDARRYGLEIFGRSCYSGLPARCRLPSDEGLHRRTHQRMAAPGERPARQGPAGAAVAVCHRLRRPAGPRLRPRPPEVSLPAGGA